MTTATVVTAGFGSFSAAHFVVTRGFAPGVVPPLPVITPSGGFDAGGFGKWFNLAYTTSSSSSRRPARREGEIGRILDELVYGEEDRAALADLDAEDRGEAEEIARDAARVVSARGETADTGRAAWALVAAQERAWQALLNTRASEARRLFIAAMAREARRAWDVEIAARISRDDADLLILAELTL